MLVFAGFVDATGTNAKFINVNYVMVDFYDNIWVADGGNHRVRKITSAGVVTTYAGSGATGSADGAYTAASFRTPYGLTLGPGNVVYIMDQSAHVMRKIA
jgi:hypothetical protein